MKSTIQKLFITAVLTLAAFMATAQSGSISGKIISEGQPMAYATVGINGTSFGASTDSTGRFRIQGIPAGTYKLQATLVGFNRMEKTITVKGERTRW